MPWTKRGEKRGCKRAESGIDRAMLRRSVTNSFKPNAPFITVNVQLDPISDTRKNLVVTLDKNEVDAEHQAVVAEFTKLARLPGFRPGKAPAAMVLKRFAKDIADEFKQKVITKAYREGLEKQKLDVLNIVKVEPGPIEPGLSAAVTLTVDIRPEFKLPEYTGLATVVSSTAASDEEVDKVIEGLRSERAEFKMADRAAQKGDYVKLSYEGTIDGKPVADLVPDKQIYGKVPQTWEEVEGENEGVIPGLGRQLAGLKTGEKKSVSVEFPAEFPAAPALAGKQASYAVEAQEIRERVLPAMDEAFFKAQQVDNLDGLKASVRNNLKLQKEYQNRGEQRRQITEALAAAVDFAVPESLVESETQSVLRQFIEENMRRGVAQEQFEKDKKELFESAGKAASKRVKLQLILAKIAEAEKIQVSEKDIDSFIYREAMRSNQKPDKLARDLAKNRDALRSVQQSIIFDKAVDFLVSKATVSEQTPKA
jgi:trigger factor